MPWFLWICMTQCRRAPCPPLTLRPLEVVNVPAGFGVTVLVEGVATRSPQSRKRGL